MSSNGDEQHLADLLPAVRDAVAALSREFGQPYDTLWADACLGAWRSVQTWRPDGGANRRTWAMRHVRWAVIDGLRRDQPKRDTRPLSLEQLIADALPGASPADVVPDPGGTTAELEHIEGRMTVDAVLAGLPELTRDLVVGHVVDGRTTVDLAREHGMTRGAANMRIVHAMRVLRRTGAARQLVASD